MLCSHSRSSAGAGWMPIRRGPRWGRPPATMNPRPLTWALVLLGTALALALGSEPAPEAREKLCGHHFVRALVSCCSGWKDDTSTGWWPKGTPRWFSFHSPCPRPLAITTAAGGQRPPTLPTTAASAAAPTRTC
ncbi:uncharacterized protein LOC121099772 isoform X2 [Ursus maritimus]|uniref:Uncharacterized protein LOC121099772 isoform X2 n=1 Tax=Ursus maritimus TaxID=29073 RepID=A0A8M1FRF3_URSMA|nr:uncharacterized protein LOC121099772 isoform X2 [Ursus maritimus]